MSNHMGTVELVASTAAQALTAAFVAFGPVITVPQANLCYIRMRYAAGTEATGMQMKIRWLRSEAGSVYHREIIWTDGGDVLNGREQVLAFVLAEAGDFDIKIDPQGRKHFQLYVKADGALGIGPGTVYGDIEHYLVSSPRS